jgi:hypothetical protein
MAEPSGVTRLSSAPSSRETKCREAGVLADDQRAAHRQRRGQHAVLEAGRCPGALAVAAAPGRDAAVGFGAVDKASSPLTPSRPRPACSRAAHRAGSRRSRRWRSRPARKPNRRRGSRCRSGRPGAPRRWCRAAPAMGDSQREVPLAGLMPTSRPPMPATSVSPTAISTPDLRSTRFSPGRCCSQRRRPLWPSQALMLRSAVCTNTRRPATSGAVKAWADSFCFHRTLPPSMATSSLLVVTTAAIGPVAADAGRQRGAALARQVSRPARGVDGHHGAVAAGHGHVSPLTSVVSGKLTSGIFTLQAWRTPSRDGLAGSSAGFGLPVPEQAARSATKTRAEPARRAAIQA